MKVFLSWSGSRSKEVADALRDWLPDVLHSVIPFMSSIDIETGRDFFRVLRSELSESNFGILCLTKDICLKPWVLFESGSLAKAVGSSSLCPYLIDMEPNELPIPLALFQAANADENGTYRLIESLNSSSELHLSEPQLRKSFEKWWPDLKPKLESKEKPLGLPTGAQNFHLINVKTSTALRAMGSPHKNGEPLALVAYSGEEQQIWTIHEVERRYYAIRSVHTRQCLDVEYGSTAHQTTIHQYRFENKDNQKWALYLNNDGSYRIRAKHSELYLSVTDGGIKQMPEDDHQNQGWWLVPHFSY